ncbi:P-loop NTPase family protein [Streptomyces scabiei]|uniref:hypothetical protein n=1 Tax=Streptomyces scabiei TaxID=1930 RepID=UPI00131CA813|nr:hypothetical protein [Streptomyces scabiei]
MEAIAAANFQGRHQELEELNSFCCARDSSEISSSYWRWLAPAWSGKSALMAHFTLNPPPEIEVVAFFITSRLARQNDVGAFCEVVQRQLYALLGEEEPLSTPYTRDEQVRLAINRAAEYCATRGRRLVLLVDGLDEDRGVTAGPDSHSIAALLPRVPPFGMRLIIAGRPHPPVPDDVPIGHPLRESSIHRWLEPSPYAHAARLDAERDLIRLLDHASLGRELVGFTVAAGGGLSADDLSALTSSRPRLVERELSAVTGRSFQKRSAHWNAAGPGIYLMAHEEIQQSAEDLISEGEISTYRARLHEWADYYRNAGWPASTPEYLLRGYTQLLSELQQTQRLVEFSCDIARHERLFQVTGADLEGLTEISISFDSLIRESLIDEQTAIDALRLALTRDKLHDRMENLPPSLMALWSRLGHIDRAVNMANSQRVFYKRGPAFVAVASSLAELGYFDKALALANDADSPRDQQKCLAAIATSLSKSKRYHEAIHVTEEICKAESRAQALGAILEEMIKPDVHKNAMDIAGRALAAIESVENPVIQGTLFARIAAAFASAGFSQQSSNAVNRAVAVAESVDTRAQEAQILALIAGALAASAELKTSAIKISNQSDEVAATLEDPADSLWVFRAVARNLASAGQYEKAIKLVERFLVNGDASSGFTDVAIAIAENGDCDQALELTNRVTDQIDIARVWNSVSGRLAKSGHTSLASEIARRTLEIIQNISDLDWKVDLLVGVAESFLLSQEEDEANSIAVLATEVARNELTPQDKVESLVSVAVTLHQSRNGERAIQLIDRAAAISRSKPYEYGCLLGLVKVAVGLNLLNRGQQAEALLADLVDTARDAVPTSERAEALEHVAEAYVAIGQRNEAKILIDEILQLSGESESLGRQRWDTLAAANGLVALGDVSAAMQLLDALPEEAVPEFLSATVERLVDSGEVDSAVSIMKRIDEETERNRSIGYVVGGLAAAGNLSRAKKLMEEISDPRMRAMATPKIVRGLAFSGAQGEARELADQLVNPEQKSEAFGALADSYGASKQGRTLLVHALCLGPWDQLVAEITSVGPDLLSKVADVLLEEGS